MRGSSWRRRGHLEAGDVTATTCGMDKPVTLEALSAVDKKAEKERKKAEAAAKRAAKKAEKDTGAVTKAASEITLDDVVDAADARSYDQGAKARRGESRSDRRPRFHSCRARCHLTRSRSLSVAARPDCHLELTRGCATACSATMARARATCSRPSRSASPASAHFVLPPPRGGAAVRSERRSGGDPARGRRGGTSGGHVGGAARGVWPRG